MTTSQTPLPNDENMQEKLASSSDELREKLTVAISYYTEANVPRNLVDKIMQLITADREHCRREGEIAGELALLEKMDEYYKTGSIKLYEENGFSMYADTRIRDLLELETAKKKETL